MPSSNVPLGSAAMAQFHAQAQALGTGVGSRRNILPLQPTVLSSSWTNVPSHSTAQSLGTGVGSRGNMLPLQLAVASSSRRSIALQQSYVVQQPAIQLPQPPLPPRPVLQLAQSQPPAHLTQPLPS